MDYSTKATSLGQKIFVLAIEIALLYLSYWVLFLNGSNSIYAYFGKELGNINDTRKILIFTFSLIVFVRMGFMMFYLLKRKLPWSETFTLILPFALYYVGYALLTVSSKPFGWFDYFGIAVFILGSLLNTASELQRHFWKQKSENKGKLYTEGLFKYSMHINFFGDLVWVTAYAIISNNIYSIIIPILLFCLFAFFNIPELDKYLAEKYKAEFSEYAHKTKKFIPFVY